MTINSRAHALVGRARVALEERKHSRNVVVADVVAIRASDTSRSASMLQMTLTVQDN